MEIIESRLPQDEKQSPPAENKMGTMPVHRLLVTMALPMVLSMLGAALYNIVDSIYVAQINENALTAVSLAFPVQALTFALAGGTSIGLNAYLSKSLGEKKFDEVNKIAGNGFFLAVVFAAMFVIVGVIAVDPFYRAQTEIDEIIQYGNEYLRIICILAIGVFTQMMSERILLSTGRTIFTMTTQGVGVIINIILDPILIFGLFGCPRMETAGAALSTVIGQLCGAGFGIFFNIRFNRDVKLSLHGLKPDSGIIKGIFKVGAPSIAMQAIGAVMTFGMNLILLSFTETAAALFGVYFKLQSFVFLPIFGMNSSLVPIIAYNYGAKHKGRITRTINLGVRYALGVTLIGTVLFLLIPSQFLSLFNASDAMLAIGVPALRIVAIHFPIAAVSITFMSVLQSLGDATRSLYISITRQLLVLLPSAWLLSLTGMLNNVWFSFPISEAISLIMCIIFLKRTFRNKLLELTI